MLTEKINNIEDKVRKLALKMERIQQENVALTEQNRKLVDELASKGTMVSDLQAKLANGQQRIVTEVKKDSGVNKKLRKEIDQYIKEIDKCIDWLQNA